MDDTTSRADDSPPEEPRADRPDLLRPAEVAALFRVAPRTVARWADEGRLSVIRTPGGHRRYPADEVVDLLAVERSRSARGVEALREGEETPRVIDVTEEAAALREAPESSRRSP